MRPWILLLCFAAGCGTTNSEDLRLEDLTVGRDLRPSMDLTEPADLAAQDLAAADLAAADLAAQDLAAADLAAQDLAAADLAAQDLAAADLAAPDLAAAPDLVRAPDLAAPDLARSPDLAAPDLTAAPDLARAPDLAVAFNCRSFMSPSGWNVDPAFRAVVVATANAGLSQPVALAFAGGAYRNRLFVVNQGNSSLVAIDLADGSATRFTAGNQWALAPRLLTTIVWDAGGVFDGRLYVGDQGSDGDDDSVLFRVAADGAATVLAKGPGPGLDDIYGLAFSPGGGGWPKGLYVTGDTDSAAVDRLHWGVFDLAGKGVGFSKVAGSEGIAFDTSGAIGGGLLAARPNGGGYAGDDTISRLKPDGTLGPPLATKLPGIHAVVLSPGGVFGTNAYAASWSSQKLLRIAPNGTVTEVANGLALTNYDGNILAISPDGNTLLVADRMANRVVCIEPK